MSLATLNATFNAAFYTGDATTDLVPNPFDVAIGGHAYVADLSFKPWKREAFRFQSVDELRAQADTSNMPGESSLNPEGLWRRTQDSWDHGAGQVHLDRKNSDVYRFRSSKGVNPWTQWQLTLLNDTTRILSSANTNLRMTVCGSYLYAIDGQALKFCSTLNGGSTTWTTVSGTPAATPSSLCSDGANVYVAYAGAGIYSTAAGGASASQYVTTAVDAAAVVGFVMGRLMVGSANHLYNITASGALPTALFTSNYPSFAWVGFADGQSVIYAAGYSGDQSIIYRVGITSDGTSLSAPIVATTLARGEVVAGIYGYAGGQVAIGSNWGFHFAEVANTNGDLTVGPLVGATVGSAQNVRCFAGYDRFIWYGWTDYDTTSTGLGRMDPSVFPVQTLVPAWASDLMVTGQGTVLDVKILGGTPVIAVSGLGFYQQASTPVASGTLDSGLISYDIIDNKVPVYLDIEQEATTYSTISAYMALNGGEFETAFAPLGTTAAGAPFTELLCTQQLCHTAEIREQLNAVNNESPILTRHTLRALPAAVTPTDIYVVVRLDQEVLNRSGQEQSMNMLDEFTYLDGLRQTKKVVTFQAWSYSASVTVEDIDMIPETVARDRKVPGGVAVVRVRTVV